MVVKRKFMLDTEASWFDAKQKMLVLDTGSWRTARPVLEKEKCNYCGLCALFCPEGCITPNQEGNFEADLFYCKGCGICARECWPRVIKMEEEVE